MTSFFVQPVPKPENIPELKPLYEHQKTDPNFVTNLENSLQMALNKASQGLNPLLFKALPFGTGKWPITFDDYANFLACFSHWIPHQDNNPAWLAPAPPLFEHQEVFDHLCFFYWLIDQPVCPGGQVLQRYYKWFEDFLVDYAKLWGSILDTPASFNDDILNSFLKFSSKYRVQDSMIGGHPNEPWHTFNDFFSRKLNPGLRPISGSGDNKVVTVPADCTYKQYYKIDSNSDIVDASGTKTSVVIKGTHAYGNVKQLLKNSKYADYFADGYFIHFFLGPYSYHRFHAPVSGEVMECYPLVGQVYLKVDIGGQQFQAYDKTTDGYEFDQARGVLTIDTSGSPDGNVGIVAVVPVGMCQVSGVNMTHKINTTCRKGDEFGYFTFGGSDIIVLFQKGANPKYNPTFFNNPPPYSPYGTELAKVSPQSRYKLPKIIAFIVLAILLLGFGYWIWRTVV
ncbi:MAG: phosphatidylserine decarboxylase [Oscillatoria sp. SIO1A7]|nr:phosphatidylserine decarboxylase [Oscillatoria sp. SIO1A7]